MANFNQMWNKNSSLSEWICEIEFWNCVVKFGMWQKESDRQQWPFWRDVLTTVPLEQPAAVSCGGNTEQQAEDRTGVVRAEGQDFGDKEFEFMGN